MLLTKSNSKILKSLGLGYETYGLHLSPFTFNSTGKNVCPFATKECVKSCLNTAGRGKFSKTQEARVRRTDKFFKDRDSFLQQMKKEFESIERRRIKYDLKIAVRLNLTSDISWEKLMINGKSLIDSFPNFIFYDYTKNPNKQSLPNYYLTFSYSGINWDICESYLKNNTNVSVVFNLNKKDTLPETYRGYKVIDGDNHDLRFLDEKGVVVGLKFKKTKEKIDLTNNKFIVNL